MKLNHFAVVVKNIEKAIQFYSDVLGWRKPKNGPFSKIYSIDTPGFKVKYVHLQIADYYLQLIEPKEGPRLKLLEEMGEGAVSTIAFRVDDIEKSYTELREKDVIPVDLHGKPFDDRKFDVAPGGIKFFFLPKEKTCGLNIEFIQSTF